MANHASSNSILGATSTATIGFGAKLWLAADNGRKGICGARYQHVVLGLICLRDSSDNFDAQRAKFSAGEINCGGGDMFVPSQKFGVRQKCDANCAWVQQFNRNLASEAMAGFVLARGSLSSHQSGEGEIRRAIHSSIP